jgi:hypothetical protein
MNIDATTIDEMTVAYSAAVVGLLNIANRNSYLSHL